MKRSILLVIAVSLNVMWCSAAMSSSRMRKETRFLTDKMAYELNLTTAQYNDVYEINYDFIESVRYLMDDVLHGYEWAVHRYYECLDVRNEDLHWVLNSRQYVRFMRTDYFFRPVYVTGGRWEFRVYIHYTNHNHFYYPRPYHYRTYCGAHSREYHNHASFYRHRYDHPAYKDDSHIHNTRTYQSNLRSDFGTVTMKPNTSVRPESARSPRRSQAVPSTSRQQTAPSATRPQNSSKPEVSGQQRTRRTSSSVQTRTGGSVDSGTSSSSRRSAGNSSAGSAGSSRRSSGSTSSSRR